MIRVIYCFTLCFISISAFSQTTVIKGGKIHTGLNEEPFVGDILFEGDTILEVSTKSLKGDVVVDALNTKTHTIHIAIAVSGLADCANF